MDVVAELTASVVEVTVVPGAEVAEGDSLLVVESMKMRIPVSAPLAGRVRSVAVAAGDIITEGDLLAVLDPIVPAD